MSVVAAQPGTALLDVFHECALLPETMWQGNKVAGDLSSAEFTNLSRSSFPRRRIAVRNVVAQQKSAGRSQSVNFANLSRSSSPRRRGPSEHGFWH